MLAKFTYLATDRLLLLALWIPLNLDNELQADPSPRLEQGREHGVQTVTVDLLLPRFSNVDLVLKNLHNSRVAIVLLSQMLIKLQLLIALVICAQMLEIQGIQLIHKCRHLYSGISSVIDVHLTRVEVHTRQNAYHELSTLLLRLSRLNE